MHRRLEHRPAQIAGAVLGKRAAAVLPPDWLTRGQRRVAGQLGRIGEAVDVADLGGDRVGEDPADSRNGEQLGDVAMIGAGPPELGCDRGDLALDLVDQLEARVDVSPPGVGELKGIEQLAALDPEQVGDRAGSPKLIRVEWMRWLSAERCLTRCKRKRASSRSRRTLGSGSRPPAPGRSGRAAPAPGRRCGRSCRRSRQALDPLGIGDQNIPTLLLEDVVAEAGAGHRLDHRPDRLAVLGDPAGECSQAAEIRRRGELSHQLALVGEQATSIFLRLRSSPACNICRGLLGACVQLTRACHPGRPFFIAFQAGVGAGRRRALESRRHLQIPQVGGHRTRADNRRASSTSAPALHPRPPR